MQHDMMLLAERLVAAMENMSQDVKNISAYVYDLTCTVSHFLNEKGGKEGTAQFFSDDRGSSPSGTPAAGMETCAEKKYSLQNECADGSSVSHSDDVGQKKISVADISFSEGIKTEEESEMEDNYESCGGGNISDNDRNDVKWFSEEMDQQLHMDSNEASFSLPAASSHSHPLSVDKRRINTQKHFLERSFPVASCSAADGTVGRDEVVDRYLPERHEEQVEVRQRQLIDQSEIGRSANSEVNCLKRGLLRLTSSAEGNEGVGRWRSYECSVCKQLCPSNSALSVHMRVHTGERPYKCSWCEKAFRWSGDFTRHMQMHKDERPHKCSRCGKAFTRRAHLIVHMRSHTGEKPFICDQCGKAFRYSDKLNLHKKTHRE